jgi:hypothetical protein
MQKEDFVVFFKVLSRYLPIVGTKSHDNLVRTGIFQAEIRTQHLPNANQKRYWLNKFARHNPVEE